MPDGAKTTVYLPEALAANIGRLADGERRSKNNMIVVLLEEALQRRQIVATTEALARSRS